VKRKVRPLWVKEFRKRQDAFVEFLTAGGSEIYKPTNSYELLRFSTPTGVGVVYCNNGGMISSWTGGAGAAWDAFANNFPWRVAPRGAAKMKKNRRDTVVESLIHRDGDSCAFCGLVLGDDITIEHFVAVAVGGNHHLTNLALAHHLCNREVGHLSVREKIEIIIKRRAAAHNEQKNGECAGADLDRAAAAGD
jgi:hypothetical protein